MLPDGFLNVETFSQTTCGMRIKHFEVIIYGKAPIIMMKSLPKWTAGLLPNLQTFT